MPDDLVDNSDVKPEEGEVLEEEKVEEVIEEDDDDEIGVQDIQKEVHAAASAHADAISVVEESENLDIAHDVDSFSSKIDGVLQDAGLTKKHLSFCCGGVVMLVVLFMIVFFGVKFLVGFVPGDGGDVVSDGVTVSQTPVTVVVEDPVDSNSDQVWVDPSIYGGILLGTDSGIEGQSGAQEGIETGATSEDFNDEFAYQIEHYGKVLNALEVDVNEYLNDFSNRSNAVDNLLVEFEGLYEEGKEIISDLEYDIAQMEAEFEGNLDQKNIYEEEFFSELSAQDGNDTVSALDAFIEISQVQVDIKARYKAKDKLHELLYSGLLYLKARIDDITYNREALVKGVQVVDVKGSDLNLIFETELE